MPSRKAFYCLRCQSRFELEHDPKKVVERTCPDCGSNSVRLVAVRPPPRKSGVAVP